MSACWDRPTDGGLDGGRVESAASSCTCREGECCSDADCVSYAHGRTSVPWLERAKPLNLNPAWGGGGGGWGAPAN